MKIFKKLLLSLFILLWTSTILYGQISPYKLVINPYTKILPNIKHSIERVDVKINNYDFAGKINIVLLQKKYKRIIEIMDLDKIINLTDLYTEYGNKLFIDSTLTKFHYKPDIFLFTYIDKEGDMVILRAEIMDTSAKSRVLKECEISYQDFIENDDWVDHEINVLSKNLISELTGVEPIFGFISLKEYQKTLGKFKYGIGIGVGSNTGNKLNLENIASELRTIPPHADDVKYRATQILSTNNPDNYLIRENSAKINLGQSLSLDIMQLSLWEIINLSIRTTSLNESGQTLNENLYRKWYVTNNTNDPDNPGSATAYVYYGIKSKSRNYFESKSFSLPLFITYPVLYAGRNKEVIFKILGGTTILLPQKIEIESEKGWYRFGEYQVQSKNNIGDLKEIEWFAGIDIEGSLSKTLKIGLQLTQIYSDYKGDLNIPLSFTLQDKGTTSLRLSLIRMF